MIRSQYPFDRLFYDQLIASRDQFQRLWEHVVPPGTGWGFSVDAGHAFRLVTVAEPQITDVCVLNQCDPGEHYAAGAQLAIEGGHITRLTRLWGTPPRSRPLCTCTADTVRPRGNPENARDHVGHGAHCTPHHWVLYSGIHPRTCYDNLRAGMAMMGLSQRFIHDNINLFQKSALDPNTGHFFMARSDAESEDYLEFYAEIPLTIVLSLCPYGDGSVEPSHWRDVVIPAHPLRVEVYDTGTEPLAWPPSDGIEASRV